MKIKYLAVSLALVATGLSSANADRLVIKGSDTLGAKLVPQLAEQFKAQHPGTTFDIAAEGSTTGIAAIIDGTAEIGMSSRRAKSSEVGAAASKGKTHETDHRRLRRHGRDRELGKPDQRPDEKTGGANFHRRRDRLERSRRIGRERSRSIRATLHRAPTPIGRNWR